MEFLERGDFPVAYGFYYVSVSISQFLFKLNWQNIFNDCRFVTCIGKEFCPW